jgi:selenocysteine lyase/cysteine desulfurase
VVSPFLPDPDKLRAVRDALPAVSAQVYLDTATAGPVPSETAAAMAEIAEHELRFGRIHPVGRADAAERHGEARAALAAVVSADIGSIALTRGADEALAVAVRGVDWDSGEVFLTVEDAGDGLELAASVAARRGARVRRLQAPLDPDLLARAAGSAPVRVVALPHVDAVGRVLPLTDLCAAARTARADAVIVVDGRLAVGAIRAVPDELGIDAYAIAGDAWLLGPESSGGLWLADPAGRLRPESGGGRADAAGFEPGPLTTRDAVGLARSAGWLAMYVGLDWVLARPASLAAGLRDRLARIAGVEVATPVDAGGPIVAFEVGGWTAEEVVEELGRRIFAVVGTIRSRVGDRRRDPLIRASLACFNEPGEVDRLAEVVELIASHTPESLPRRAPLTILSG